MFRKDRRVTAVLYPLVLMALIFAESSIPMAGGPDTIKFLTELDPTIQNLLHIPLYGTLAYLWCKAFSKRNTSLKKIIVCSLIITILYGCFDEFHQSFVKGRYGSLLDVYLNTVGALIGVFVFKKAGYGK